jgi:hypothetical protein
VTISLFEIIETTSQALARKLRELLDSYGLSKKIIVYVKDEGVDLNSMTKTLKLIINHEVLGLKESSNGICFGHAFSKTYYYVISEERVCKNLKYVLINFV